MGTVVHLGAPVVQRLVSPCSAHSLLQSRWCLALTRVGEVTKSRVHLRFRSGVSLVQALRMHTLKNGDPDFEHRPNLILLCAWPPVTKYWWLCSTSGLPLRLCSNSRGPVVTLVTHEQLDAPGLRVSNHLCLLLGRQSAHTHSRPSCCPGGLGIIGGSQWKCEAKLAVSVRHPLLSSVPVVLR